MFNCISDHQSITSTIILSVHLMFTSAPLLSVHLSCPYSLYIIPSVELYVLLLLYYNDHPPLSIIMTVEFCK